MRHIKIEGNKYLLKDAYTKAILNTNKDEIVQYNNKINNEKKIKTLEHELENLKKQLNMLTGLLLKKVENNNVN
jgi:tetrahydromethanopterin S-methyltransferase subunit B